MCMEFLVSLLRNAGFFSCKNFFLSNPYTAKNRKVCNPATFVNSSMRKSAIYLAEGIHFSWFSFWMQDKLFRKTLKIIFFCVTRSFQFRWKIKWKCPKMLQNPPVIIEHDLNLYISYALGPQLRNLNTDFTLHNCLFGSVELTKNADLQSVTKYLRLTLVFTWSSGLRGKINFYFSLVLTKFSPW